MKWHELFHFDSKLKKIISICFSCSLFLCFASITLVLLYHYHTLSHNFYLASLQLFRTSLTVAISSIVCAVAMNTIAKGY